MSEKNIKNQRQDSFDQEHDKVSIPKALTLLVSDVGKMINIPELQLDDNGICTLGIDDNLIISLGYNASQESVDVLCCLDSIPLTDQLVLRALMANFMWIDTQGATFSIEEQSNSLILLTRLAFQGVSTQSFLQHISQFINVTEYWHKSFLELAKKAKDTNGAPTASPSPPLKDTTQGLRV